MSADTAKWQCQPVGHNVYCQGESMTHLTCSRSVLSVRTFKAGSSVPVKAVLHLIVTLEVHRHPRLHQRILSMPISGLGCDIHAVVSGQKNSPQLSSRILHFCACMARQVQILCLTNCVLLGLLTLEDAAPNFAGSDAKSRFSEVHDIGSQLMWLPLPAWNFKVEDSGCRASAHSKTELPKCMVP